MVSFNAAQILGIAGSGRHTGTGQRPTLFISQGDALDIRTQNVKYAFIQGRNLDLFDHQKEIISDLQGKICNKALKFWCNIFTDKSTF